MSSSFSQSELSHFTKLLTVLKQELLASNDAGKEGTKPVILDQTSVGRLSRMDAMQGQAVALAAQRRRDQRLHAIDIALRKIAEGSFGLCIECDEEIAIRRLEFDPTVTLCIRCASQKEQR